jgi:hypothetical protein
MRVLLPLALLALTGCQSVEQLRALAPQQSDYEICRASMTGGPNLRQAAGEEQRRRNLNCAPYASAIVQQEQGQSATALQLLQMSQPRPAPIPMPQSTTCISRPSLGSVYTTCN